MKQKNNDLDIKGIENFIKIENLNVENDSNKKRSINATKRWVCSNLEYDWFYSKIRSFESRN